MYHADKMLLDKMLLCGKIKRGAVFIADSHYRSSGDLSSLDFVAKSSPKSTQKSSIESSHKNSAESALDLKLDFEKATKKATKADSSMDLLEVLDSFISLPPSDLPPQVFLMGDIADLFIGHIPSSLRFNQNLIDKINALSQKCEVFYFEGNHDFGIDSSILPNVKIYPRFLQPALFDFDGQIYALAHGDIFIGNGYEIYIKAMNSALTLSALKLLDICSFGKIYDFANAKVNAKKIHHLEFAKDSFCSFAKRRVECYVNAIAKSSKICVGKSEGTSQKIQIRGIIEGHFHIGQKISQSFGKFGDIEYISLPSFYCQREIFTLL